MRFSTRLIMLRFSVQPTSKPRLIATSHLLNQNSPPIPLATSRRCNTCGRNSPLIYTVGWMCTESTCSELFKVRISDNPQRLLAYTELSWKAVSTRWPKTLHMMIRFSYSRLRCSRNPLFQLCLLPSPNPYGVGGHPASANLLGSFYCESCGRLSCR